MRHHELNPQVNSQPYIGQTTTTTSTIGGGDSHATGHTAILGASFGSGHGADSCVYTVYNNNNIYIYMGLDLFFPKALRRVLPENPLNTDTSTLTLTH